MERAVRPGAGAVWRAAALVLAVLAIAGCGEPPDGIDASDEIDQIGTPLFREDRDPRIARILEPALDDPLLRSPPLVRVLTAYDATNYFVAAGEQRGLEYELMRDFESFLAARRPREPHPRVVFVAMRFDELIPSLLAGHGDVVAAGLTVTEERRRRVAFSEPYREGVREVVVRNREAAPVTAPEDLAGRVVHVVRGSSYAEHLRELAARLGPRLPPLRVVEVDPRLRTEDVLEMVHAGIYQLSVVDDHMAALWSRVLDDLVVEDVAIHEGGRLAWAVRPGDDALRTALDAYARERRQGTLLGNLLFRRYYADTRWVEDPTAPIPQGRLQELAGALQESGERHGFDWLALAAIAFQESRFDPAARSRAGAVGVMQIRPATAAEVGVEDPSSVPANVEAAARYLARLRERFAAEDLPPATRFDFVLAAYNAGPARLDGLRKRAARAGLRPDRWFGNVEHVARAQLGSETVRYVANVNKIYLALRSVRHQLEARERARDRQLGS